jgi:hypothetical protein
MTRRPRPQPAGDRSRVWRDNVSFLLPKSLDPAPPPPPVRPPSAASRSWPTAGNLRLSPQASALSWAKTPPAPVERDSFHQPLSPRRRAPRAAAAQRTPLGLALGGWWFPGCKPDLALRDGETCDQSISNSIRWLWLRKILGEAPDVATARAGNQMTRALTGCLPASLIIASPSVGSIQRLARGWVT